MLVEKIFIFLVCSVSLVGFYVFLLSTLRFLSSNSVSEKFGIIFIDLLMVISIIFYLIFSNEIIYFYNKVIDDSITKELYVWVLHNN